MHHPWLWSVRHSRVFVSGRSLVPVFVVEIDSQSEPAARIDLSQTDNPALPHRVIQLPREVEVASRALMKKLGLMFGALDFVRTPDDEWIFLEVNANGQWLWLDDKLSLGISEALATWSADVASGSVTSPFSSSMGYFEG